MGPLLKENQRAIKYFQRDTRSYGPHPRQKLDIYTPFNMTEELRKEERITFPVLIFLYGGGLTHGDKIIDAIPEGLAYHNVGAFFAERGITTIIPDYRRVNTGSSGEDAAYPSGADDLKAVLELVATLYLDVKTEVHILGNSAGGVHAATFMLEPKFLEYRKTLLSGKGPLLLKGIIELGVPFDFKEAVGGRTNMLQTYYGSDENVKEHQAYGLLEALTKGGKTSKECAIPKVLAILSAYDPEGEIRRPAKEFVALWKKTWKDGIELWDIAGHNHISPPVALMTRDQKLEKWGEDVVGWISGGN